MVAIFILHQMIFTENLPIVPNGIIKSFKINVNISPHLHKNLRISFPFLQILNLYSNKMEDFIMKKDTDKKYNIQDLTIQACSTTDCTGLIPAIPAEEEDLENYEDIYPYLAKRD